MSVTSHSLLRPPNITACTHETLKLNPRPHVAPTTPPVCACVSTSNEADSGCCQHKPHQRPFLTRTGNVRHWSSPRPSQRMVVLRRRAFQSHGLQVSLHLRKAGPTGRLLLQRQSRQTCAQDPQARGYAGQLRNCEGTWQRKQVNGVNICTQAAIKLDRHQAYRSYNPAGPRGLLTSRQGPDPTATSLRCYAFTPCSPGVTASQLLYV